MRNAFVLKSCSSVMFEHFASTSNMAAKGNAQSVRAENTVTGAAYGVLEHRGILFEPSVRENSQLLEHKPTTLEGWGYVRAGHTFKSYLFGGPGEGLLCAPRRVNELPSWPATGGRRTAEPGSPGEASIKNLLPISQPHRPGRLTVRLAFSRSHGDTPCP
jgi:hypothetical protein